MKKPVILIATTVMAAALCACVCKSQTDANANHVTIPQSEVQCADEDTPRIPKIILRRGHGMPV